MNLLTSETHTHTLKVAVRVVRVVCEGGVTFWSLVGAFPAGEAERPNHDIAAAQTQQEVEEEVVSVPVTHLRQTQRLCLCRLTARPCGNVLQDACFSLWWPPHSVPTVLHCVDAVLWVVAASSSRFTSSDHRTFQSAGSFNTAPPVGGGALWVLLV